MGRARGPCWGAPEWTPSGLELLPAHGARKTPRKQRSAHVAWTELVTEARVSPPGPTPQGPRKPYLPLPPAPGRGRSWHRGKSSQLGPILACGAAPGAGKESVRCPAPQRLGGPSASRLLWAPARSGAAQWCPDQQVPSIRVITAPVLLTADAARAPQPLSNNLEVLTAPLKSGPWPLAELCPFPHTRWCGSPQLFSSPLDLGATCGGLATPAHVPGTGFC